MKNKKENLIVVILLLFMYLLFFQNPLSLKFHFLGWLDEIVGIIGFFLILKDCRKLKINLFLFRLILCLFGISIIGFLSIILFEKQPLYVAVGDWFVYCKFFFVMYSAYVLSQRLNINKYSNLFLKHVYLIETFILVLTIIDYLTGILPFAGVQYGIRSLKLFWYHPTYLAGSLMFLISLQIAFSDKNSKKSVFFIIADAVLIILTTTSKAIAGATLALLLYVYLLKSNKVLKFKHFFIFGIVAVIIGLPKIGFYFGLEDGARAMLSKTSIKIASDYFPLGAGFGTYGSFMSVDWVYSPIYSEYGLSHIYGLTKENPEFASDSFWPTLLGEVGYFGTLLYITFLFLVIYNITKKYDKLKLSSYCSKLVCIFYLLIDSVGESAFFNPISIPLAVMIGFDMYKEESDL